MRVVSKRLFIAAFLFTSAAVIPQTQAQTRPLTGEEYLRSVSIQSKERSVQGPAENGVQRVADIAALPTRRQVTATETAGYTPKNSNNFVNSPSGPFAFQTAQSQTAPPAATNSGSRYPYPAQTPPQVGPTYQTNPGFNGSRTFVNSASTINGTRAENGNPILGTNATFGTKSTTNTVAPAYPAGTNYTVPQPVLTSYPNTITAPTNYLTPSYPPASYPPTSYPPTNYPSTIYGPTSVSPNVGAFRQGINGAPTTALGPANIANPGVANQSPTLGGQTIGTNFLSPTQVAPQPIYPAAAPVPLQNLPPGTYQGTGLDGRPVTYVDGQPVRNLMRYIVQ